jgi:predicted AAA+ superfamily ATPase
LLAIGVCWLLGIREVSQLTAHPLRGAIFESWVVSEIIKQRLADGEANGIYFFRDKAGLEADVMVQRGNRFLVAEVKAGQTIASDMASAIGRVAALLTAGGVGTDTVVVYGGAARQSRSAVVYLPWNEIQEFTWAR